MLPTQPFLIIRTPPRPGSPHAYDIVLKWVEENFPEYSHLFHLEALPFELPRTPCFSLHIAWLKDPVEAWSMEIREQAARLASECDARGIPVVNRVDRLLNATKFRGGELMHFAVTSREHEHARSVGKATGQLEKEVTRLRIDEVRVVDHQDCRSPLQRLFELDVEQIEEPSNVEITTIRKPDYA